MAKSTPEKSAFGPGQHRIRPTPEACMVFSSVVQGSIETIANDLAARPDLDKPARLAIFDRFISQLVQDAKNSAVDNVSPADETTAKELVCKLIATHAVAPRRELE